MFLKKSILSLFAVLFSATFSYGQTQYPTSNYTVAERYPLNETQVSIDLNTSSLGDNRLLTGHSIYTQPQYGTLNTSSGTSYIYIPNNYNEQSDEFVWEALEDNGTAFNPIQYKVVIDVTPVNNPPIFSGTVLNTYSVDENQNQIVTVTVIDYDSDASAGNLSLAISENSNAAYSSDDNLFDVSFSSKSGSASYIFNLIFKSGIIPNFESPPLAKTTFTFDLNATDDGGSSVLFTPIAVTLQNVNEPPVILSSTTFNRTISEGENTETKEDFSPIQINAGDPEGNNVYWTYTISNSNIGGTVKLNSSALTEGQMTASSFNSNTNINFDYIPDPDDYGTQVISFTAYDAGTGGIASADTIDITFTIDRVDDDPISLNENSAISVNWVENVIGTLHDFNPTDPDSTANGNNLIDNNTSSFEGAKIYYDISGEDEEFFTISSTGELTFLSAPDFENPVDQTGGNQNQLEGNNIYDITVTVRDRSDAASNLTNSDSIPVTVTVTNVNELPTLNSGTYSYNISITEDNVWTWSNSMFSLLASDVDAGHQAALDWGVKFGNDGNFGTAVASGTGTEPSSLTYTPNFDYDGTSGNDIFIVEISDGVGTVELDFNVSFVAVSDPPRLDYISPAPNEPISIAQEFYTIPLFENNPSLVRVDYTEVDGDSISSIEFEGGEQILDNEDFNMTVYLAQKYAEISFKPDRLPDYEAPGDDNGDNNYSVKLAATESTGKTLSIRLDFIIQNVDDAPEFSPVTNYIPSAAENQTSVATLTGADPEGASTFYWSVDPLNDYVWFEFEYDQNTPVGSNSLRFVTPPDFENPLDGTASGDKNNTYTVNVRISDQAVGGISSTAAFTVRVTDVNDAPVITPIPLNIDEPLKQNASMQLSHYVTDEDNQSGAGPDTITWLEVGGDTDAFALDLNGSLKFNLPSDYESVTSYQILVRASDGRGGYHDANFTIDVNEQPEAPEFFAGPASNVKISFLQYTLDEDTSVSANLSDHARDPDNNSSLGLTFTSNFINYDGSNDSNGTLELNELSGALKFTPKANYEGLTYIDISVTDGSNPSIFPLVFDVVDVPDAPVIREGNGTSLLSSEITRIILENNSTWSMELNASDPYDIPPSSVFIWSLSGPDAPKFRVMPSSGYLTTLTLRNPPNYESPDDNNTDNVYDLNITVTDVENTSHSFNLLLSTINDDEPAYFEYSDDNASPVIQKDAGTFSEHTISTSLSNVTVFNTIAKDYEGNPLTYGLTPHNPGDNSGNLGPSNNHYNDNNTSLFEINPTTGRITFKDPAKIDFERGLGSVLDNNNSYVLEVNATDDTANPDQVRHLIYLTIQNVVEDPEIRDGSGNSVASLSTTVSENLVADPNFSIETFSEDDNLTVVVVLSGGDDQDKFTLNVATGQLEFLAAQDFENPTDSNGDGIYHVQLGISGTPTVQDRYYSITNANDDPVITNAALTQVVVPENTGYVLDIEVSDQDSGNPFPDLVFVNGSTSVDFISHSGNSTTISDFYNGSVSSPTGTYAGPTYVVSEDFDNDGYYDLVALNQNANSIEISKFNSASLVFDAPATLTAGDDGPKFAIATDLDEDGFKDLVVSFVGENNDTIGWYPNNSGSFGSMQKLITSSSLSVGSIDFEHFAMGDIDGNSHLDIVIARKSNNAVDIYLNNGSNAFSLDQSLTSFGSGNLIVFPSYVELADFDSSGTSDLLISARGELSLAHSSGLGSDSRVMLSFTLLESYSGQEGRFAKAFDLTRDGKLDVVFATGQTLVPKVLVQNATGFNTSIPLTNNAYSAQALGYPSDARLIPATDLTRETLVIADQNSQYFSLYEAKPANDGSFEEPIFVDAGTTNKFVVLSDLNRSEEVFTYSFDGGEDELTFDEPRFNNDGKLYFQSPFPDFENPTDNGGANRYDVIVKVADQNGGSTSKTVSVTVSDVNDQPVITSLDGNWTSSFDHNESNASLYLFTVTATNEEDYLLETISFSKSGGADQQFFDVDVVSGAVSLFVQPDYETPLDTGANNSYNLIVRATDSGGAYDEQNVTVFITDTYEPPVFGLPVISNPNLTKLELEENRGFIVDLSVVDPNATKENSDIVFIASETNELRYLSHTDNNSSISAMYPSSGTSLIDSLGNPSQVVNGDFNKDGYDDLLVLSLAVNPTPDEIKYFEYDPNTSGFAPSVSLDLGTAVNPKDMVVKDLDQDGDLDLIVSFNEPAADKIGWFENNAGAFSQQSNLITTTTSQTISHFAFGDVDGDSYDDLLTPRLNGVIDVYLNDKTTPVSFTWKQNITNIFSKPRHLELSDIDNSGTLDLLISAKDEVLVGYNNGLGTNGLLSFTFSTLGTYAGEGRFAKAYDLTADGMLDIVYAAQINAPPNVLVQSVSGFSSPTPLSLHQDSNLALSFPSDLEIIPENGQNGTTLVFSDDSSHYVSLYETTAQKNGTFENPVALNIGSSTKSILLSDTGRQAQVFQYSFVGGEDRSKFDENRFHDDGKLYFSSPLPDYEYPTDVGEFNRYDVLVKVEDSNNLSTTQSVVVLVTDVNDRPYISSLDGNWTSSFLHSETSQTLDLFSVVATNTETTTGNEVLTYSILQQADHQFFEINASTGLVSLLAVPDYENPLDSDLDNNYSILIRVTDDGTSPEYDEQNVTVVILDGPEAPTFGDNNKTFEIMEDTALLNIDINVTDDNANPAPGPGIANLSSTGESNGIVSFDLLNQRFSYTPDANFTGIESFTITAENHQGLTVSYDVNVTVTSINDLPEITSPRIIDVAEGVQRVAILKANDDSAGELVWSWVDTSSPDTVFTISDEGLVQFRDLNGADFEELTSQVQDFLPTDAVNLSLWLDADDNQTLYKTQNFNDFANYGIGGWKDKSGMGNHLDQTTSNNRPILAPASINGKTAVDFEGDISTHFLESTTRLGLGTNPDLLIFAVTHIETSVGLSDEIIQIGNSPGFFQTTAGSQGWAWRYGDGYIFYGTITDNSTGLQVWERPASGNYGASKFYLNGTEQSLINSSNDNLFPSNTDAYLQVGSSLNGQIGELIVLNSVDSDDRIKLEGYLAHKWGLSTNLSNDHPYRYNRPTHIKWERPIRITDSDGNFTDSNFTFRVANQNDNVPVINNSELLSSSTIYRYESSSLNPSNYSVIDLNITDMDGDILELNIIGGNDRSYFSLNDTNLSFVSANSLFPDFESPDDANGDNIYEVEIEITDGNPLHTINLFLKVDIMNANEDPPSFTYGNQVITSLDVNRSENNSSVIQLTTIDDWTGPIEYSISSGNDKLLFDINKTTGLLTFKIPPNFEIRDDNNTDNIYEIQVTATDDGNYSSTLLVDVNVTDINEPPGLGVTLPVQVNEDSSVTFVMEIFDPEDPNQTIYPFEFPPKVSPAHGTFTDAGQGQYTYVPNPNYNGPDQIVITVNDDNLQNDFNVTFQVNPVPDNPMALDDEFIVELNKGQAIPLDVLYNDSNLPDANNSVGLSIVSGSIIQPSNGNIEIMNGTTLHYTPNSTFIGTDSFTYTMRNDSNLTATAKGKIIVENAEDLNKWSFLDNFGFFMLSNNNWAFHADLGWIFVQEVNKLNTASWIWHEQIGWFWTGEKYAPDLYINDFSSWFRFSSSIANGVYLTWPIYDQDEKEWLNTESFVQKQQNLVKGQISQALEGLNSNDEIIQYIETLSFFTNDQKATIKFELKFKGISKTLSTLLRE